ncbi:MAG TPA: polyphosphate kinase 1 [Candidatus Dormibacteraeota bacterium]|nr:polyphosphate kinase 1 [Candidatus Dormibacteraeota bacterium]
MAGKAKERVFGPGDFINRELSWLEFNQRVLDEAIDKRNPLLERLKFFCIVSSNLDEFFEVRVAGIKQQIESDTVERSMDGLTATENFQAIVKRVKRMVEDQYTCLRESLLPELSNNGIRILDISALELPDLAWLAQYFRTQVRPVLTPLAIDPAHPFPQLLNKSLNLIVRLELEKNGEMLKHLAVVQIPRILPRMIKLPREDGRQDYLYLSRLIGHHLGDLFPGTRILGYWPFRVTRNSELYIDEEETANLLKAVENELHNRRKGDAVRLEIDYECPPYIREALLKTFRLTEDDLYLIDGPLNPTRLMALYEGDHSPELRDPPFVAPIAASVRDETDLFAAIRERDILLHHPYENFDTVVGFLEQVANDPDVLAIKQTLYRTGGDPRIIGALESAVKNGKQVTAVVELRARFDEANNILWARQLEESGVHVVYGLVGYKIHAKSLLVVRREGHHIRRYVHLATGNYNPTTAKLYTDVCLFTCRPEFGEDATNFFNLLTGICQFQGLQKLIAAPFELHTRLLQLVEREAENARRGLPARIILKLNSLAERQVIEALYRASQAGVQIDLIVRGICCLRPGVKGLSENIAVRSIVDRFLEHSRLYYFENACQPQVFVASADWMQRNFFRRIELAFPVEDGVLRERLIREVLSTSLADNTKARVLQRDGSYRCLSPRRGEKSIRSQGEFIKLSAGGDPIHSQAIDGKRRFPKVKLAPSPFAAKKSRA